MMKTLKFLEPRKMEIVEEEIPKLQSDDEVLVEICYSCICRSDLELLNGKHPHLVNKNAFYPIIPGHEWSAIVVEVGKNVTEFKAGDKVVGDVSLGCGRCEMCKTGKFNLCPEREVIGSYRNRQGSFAQYIRTHRRSLYKIPEGLTLLDAATVEPAATSAYVVKKSRVKYGDRVLVIGDGPIGLFAIEAARAFGAAEVGLVGSWPEKIQLAMDNGAKFGISYRTGDVDEKLEEIMQGEKFDVIIETSGNVSSVNRAIKWIKPSGVIGLVSFYSGATDINMNDVITKDAEIQGALASPNMFSPTLLEMKNGIVKTRPYITHVIDFKDIEKAFELAESRTEMSVKIAIKVKEDLNENE